MKKITTLFSKIENVKQNIQNKFGSERIQMVEVSKLKFDKDFKELFAQEPEKVERIATDMKTHGFDKSQPLIVTKDFAILDGNSRFLACQKVGIKTVPVVIKDFSDKDKALQYELHLQLDRRNLSDAEIFAMFTKLEGMKTKAKAENKSTDEFTDKKVAEQLKISERQVQKIREISKKTNPETLEKITSGEISINQAYSEVKKEEDENKSKLPKTTSLVEFRRGAAFALNELAKGKTTQEIMTMIQEA